MAAGYAAGVSIEVKDEKMTNRSRKIKFFLDKMKAQENQTDSVAKLVKDLIVRKVITWVKAAATDYWIGAVVTCTCSCHDCGSGYSGDSNPLQFSICFISATT